MGETFAEEVLRRRAQMRLSQVELANLAGIHRGTVRNVEQGKPTSSLVMARIRAVLDGTDGADAVPVEIRGELRALSVGVEMLEPLTPSERHRVLAYLNDRYGGGSDG